MGTFYNGFTESYYVVLQEYPSTKTSCHSVYTPYAYSAITLIHSINVYIYIYIYIYIHARTHARSLAYPLTHPLTPSFVGFFIEKTTRVSVFEEKNRMFLKAYALVGIEPSLTN
jgi:hypothetical protein